MKGGTGCFVFVELATVELRDEDDENEFLLLLKVESLLFLLKDFFCPKERFEECRL